jgi:hypothetical protein
LPDPAAIAISACCKKVKLVLVVLFYIKETDFALGLLLLLLLLHLSHLLG